MIRRIAALLGGALVSLGIRLENAAEAPPDLADTDSCARCRGRYAIAPEQLAELVRNAANGVPLATITLEAETLYRVPDRD